MENFKDIEPDDSCPPNLKGELISEIDSIRNGLRIVDLYVGDFLSVISSLFKSSEKPPSSPE
ncbi:MAG: hypothetical protein EAZ91_10135 [Cytophagales bacterium]|nr:MAG: hypothetical protein EAZ91_10135 [Cytophagales bacterium]